MAELGDPEFEEHPFGFHDGFVSEPLLSTGFESHLERFRAEGSGTLHIYGLGKTYVGSGPLKETKTRLFKQ